MGGRRRKPYPTAMIPKLNLNICSIGLRAETDPSLMVYESSLENGIMITDGADVMIVTGVDGYLRLKRSDIPALIEELRNVERDMSKNIWRRRNEVSGM